MLGAEFSGAPSGRLGRTRRAKGGTTAPGPKACGAAFEPGAARSAFVMRVGFDTGTCQGCVGGEAPTARSYAWSVRGHVDGLSTTTLANRHNRSSVRGYGWGSVVGDADGYAPTEVWEKYCGGAQYAGHQNSGWVCSRTLPFLYRSMVPQPCVHWRFTSRSGRYSMVAGHQPAQG